MRRKFVWEWERLDDITWRAKVIGGWVMAHGLPPMTVEDFKKGKPSASLVFIPDSEHCWGIIPKMQETAIQTPKIKAADFEAPK